MCGNDGALLRGVNTMRALSKRLLSLVEHQHAVSAALVPVYTLVGQSNQVLARLELDQGTVSHQEFRREPVFVSNGNTLARSATVDSDSTQAQITGCSGDCGVTKGKAVDLKLTLQNARLYSYWISRSVAT